MTFTPTRSSMPAARWASWSRSCASAASTPRASTSPSTRSPRSTSRSRERCSVASLTEPLPRRYDLIACIEVLEHLPTAETDKAIANLCQATDRLLISTTPQDFGEPTHLNVQPPEAWSAALASHGFFRDLERDFSYISPWAALYTRVEEPQAETVRRYDRAWWRLRREISEVRGSLLQTQERLAKLEERGREAAASPGRAGPAKRGDPAAARPADRQGRRTRRGPRPARRVRRPLAALART